MDPQASNVSQANPEAEERSRRRGPGIIGGRAERRILGYGARLAIRAGIAVSRFVLTWFIQTIAVWIAILFVSVSTFLIVLFFGN
ncbi:MAG: hypothetical protein AAB583_02280 [Patescibacteria group bacterium]